MPTKETANSKNHEHQALLGQIATLEREFEAHQKMWVESVVMVGRNLERERLLRQVAEEQVADLTKRLADRTLEAQRIGNELTEAYRLKDIQFERAEQAERERDEARGISLQLRRRVHFAERHNQHFERCESAWCNPSPYENPALEAMRGYQQADTGRATRP